MKTLHGEPTTSSNQSLEVSELIEALGVQIKLLDQDAFAEPKYSSDTTPEEASSVDDSIREEVEVRRSSRPGRGKHSARRTIAAETQETATEDISNTINAFVEKLDEEKSGKSGDTFKQITSCAAMKKIDKLTIFTL